VTDGSGRLILLRHGESTWNLARRFTGWADPPLSGTGYAESVAAGRALAEAGLVPDIVFTSVLTRAAQSVRAVGEGLETSLECECSWRLNERHYGALEGMRHANARSLFGAADVERWRRSWASRPPPLESTDPRHPSHDPRYADVAADELPCAESLAECLVRHQPYVEGQVADTVAGGAVVLLVGHGNSLRALVADFDHIAPDDVPALLIPTAVPLVYRYEDGWSREPDTFPVHGTWTGP
jgi:2,3-bisphosphoglycerate-dependent phosphoglycerate mutase